MRSSAPCAVFKRASMGLSIAESMRLIKKLATLATPLGSPPPATNASRPEIYASATASYIDIWNSRVTLTLIPSLMSCLMAGMPAGVAGTLIMTFGRDTVCHSRRASAMVPAVSWARYGETSRLT